MHHPLLDTIEYYLLLVSYFINLEQSKVASGGVLFAFFRHVLRVEKKRYSGKQRLTELAFVFTVIYLLYPWLVNYFTVDYMPLVAATIGWAGYQSIIELLDQCWLFVRGKINQNTNIVDPAYQPLKRVDKTAQPPQQKQQDQDLSDQDNSTQSNRSDKFK